MVKPPEHISSRSNALLVQLRKLLHDGAAYRKQGLLWIEGDHLCRAARDHAVPVRQALVSESGWSTPALRELAAHAERSSVVSDALWPGISSLPSPAAIGFVLAAPEAKPLLPEAHSVVLDRLQDPGNVGSILRSAAALGVRQVLALEGTVALWSPKVLRAAMGAHFGLSLNEGLGVDQLAALKVPLLATGSHLGEILGRMPLPHPAAWVFGHEGQGVAAAIAQRCARTLRIPQPGGEESLNVAAAAAICLYESARQRDR